MYPLIRKAAASDAYELAPHLRQRDVEEIRAGTGLEPLPALLRSFNDSTLAWTAFDEDGPFAIFGVGPLDTDTGSPWLLGADRLTRKHRMYFLQNSRPYITQMHDLFPLLLNYVDARHTDSLVYLKRVGFTISKLIPEWGFERRPFYRFIKVS